MPLALLPAGWEELTDAQKLMAIAGRSLDEMLVAINWPRDGLDAHQTSVKKEMIRLTVSTTRELTIHSYCDAENARIVDRLAAALDVSRTRSRQRPPMSPRPRKPPHPSRIDGSEYRYEKAPQRKMRAIPMHQACAEIRQQIARALVACGLGKGLGEGPCGSPYR
jgi:hypothetical protein